MSREDRLNEMYVALFQELYNDYTQVGMDSEEAQCKAHGKVELCKELIEDVLSDLDNDKWYCSLRRVVPTGLIEGWSEKDLTEKELTLYNLGCDIRLPWREKRGEHVVGNKRYNGLYAEASERLDNEWIHSGNASMDAIIEYEGRVRGKDHKLDLEEMNRQ